jgi:hypothetical protein
MRIRHRGDEPWRESGFHQMNGKESFESYTQSRSRDNYVISQYWTVKIHGYFSRYKRPMMARIGVAFGGSDAIAQLQLNRTGTSTT